MYNMCGVYYLSVSIIYSHSEVKAVVDRRVLVQIEGHVPDVVQPVEGGLPRVVQRADGPHDVSWFVD